MAIPRLTDSYFEDHSRRVGYKTVNEAIKEFEKDCNFEVKLPTLMPKIPFTHEFGSLNNENGIKNNILEILYVNRKLKGNQFKIEIRKEETHFDGEIYRLHDGKNGIYFEDHLFTYLVFEQNNLQYQIGLDKKVANQDTVKVLIEVADSIK
ncbi:carbon monoxide dehydrogenase [Ureibacillus aquaedulcis]|uniref:Carbon monoxide dehydrogenase n=1 Tax=Ureibacillus aquaedulcis TaxID=3058421 RepID=A0ABT8GMV7_9BACL|nr:carbon monoxide dehydrogenase [Ureibacillus sp. BA0131]MDN4492750.1 carbon monoxide dehydrogenase [Ureibacillus sp. BA0131]